VGRIHERTRGEHLHADHATCAAFWHLWLAQLEVVFISRAASGVVGVLRRFQTFRQVSDWVAQWKVSS
jgi:hypothetical protein